MNVYGDVITIRKIADDSHINSRPAVSTIRKFPVMLTQIPDLL